MRIEFIFIWAILVYFFKIRPKTFFLLAIIALAMVTFLILTNHQGAALRALTYLFWLFVIAVLQYSIEALKNEK